MSIIQLHHAYQHHMNNQSYTSSANHSHINQNEVINTINQQPESDLGDFTLDQDGWDNLISYLEELDVFRRIRYADEINKLNGFEVVGEVLIREWKMEVAGKHFLKKGMTEIKPAKTIFEKKELDLAKGLQMKNMRLKCKFTKGNSDRMISRKSDSDYHKAYIKLLSK